MINAKSRFIRAMKRVKRARLSDENYSVPPPYFAVYENLDERILVSEDGIFLDKCKKNIQYSEIERATCMINDDVLLDGVMLFMKDGRNLKVDVSGHDDRIYDAHSFLRFLMRTLEDRSTQK